MLPAKIKPHNERKPLPWSEGNGFLFLRKAIELILSQRKEFDATRVLLVPKKGHFLNRSPRLIYEALHNLFCTKKHGACLPVFSRKGVA
jgi:hypothetical protein